ncbi:hypothetical protein GVAV_000634 [Gurleya vavrai]
MLRIINILLFLFLFFFYFIYSALAVLIMMIVRILLVCTDIQHRFTLKIKEMWLTLTVTLLGLYFIHPTHICFNKKVFEKKKCIVLSNHLTNYDWIFVLVILNRLKMYREIVIILKESLKNIPIYGYGMRTFGYIFLKREWNTDRNILQNGLKQLRQKDKFYLLLFPEGTLIDSETHAKSKKFALENNVTVNNKVFNPENVLLPRKTGYEMIFENLSDSIEAIVDITLITNPYLEYPSETFDLNDVFVKKTGKVNFCAFVDVIENTEKIRKKDWIYELYEEKDNLINEYKNNKKEIMNLKDFKKYCSTELKYKTKNYDFDSVYIWSENSRFYYLALCTITIAFLLYFIY